MPNLKDGTVLPTAEEDAQIQAGIDTDPDTYSLSDAEWEAVRPTVGVGQLKAGSHVFEMTASRAKTATKHVSEREILALVDEALDWARGGID